ncbi:MAG: ABC transporter permease [Bacilli bacterium]|nr:ABC transporter permease [Bacilli bacterium]
MKKYLFIFKSEIMSNLQYITNIVIGFIGYFVILYIFFNLWQYIYSDPSELINGYSMNQMIWYVIITEVIWSVLSGRKLCARISEDVKAGNIAYNINKPYSYIGYCLSTHLGACTVRSAIYIFIGMVVGFMFLHSFPQLTLLNILAIFITYVFALVISILLITSIGLISFFIEDSGPLYWLYSKFILVLGVIFPVEFFPIWLRGIIKYSPIYAVSYGPARLFVNFSWNNFILVIISQVIYIIVSYMICSLLYKKGVKNLNVNGG